ncbi:MAG: S8 family serine peptidase [Bacteroidota bacterium]
MDICIVCGSAEASLVHHFEGQQNEPLLEVIREKAPNWSSDSAICTECLDSVHQELLSGLLNVQNYSFGGIRVLPTPIRLNANPKYTGKGVTICMIDSGFYPHPDLTIPNNRIKKIVDITQPNRPQSYFEQPHNVSWHGTMTSVVCAGNGHLSNGLYKGIAHEASLVLLKVSNDSGAIPGARIAQALQWVCEHHEEYDIRIVNLSVADDYDISFHVSEVAKAIRVLTKKGIIVVAAVGNDPNAPIIPPANAPEVIAVGGLNDQNTLEPLQQTLYHSSYGWTIDGLLKPELIAPAIWLAAPILPKTDTYQQASELFHEFYRATGERKDQLLQEIRRRKLISEYYQHADGTSFAAPIVCSVIAQMLEANPDLTLEMIRENLLTTAHPLPYEDRKRQGYGVIQPAHAVAKASQETHHQWIKTSPIIDYEARTISFHFHHHDAEQIILTGTFSGWSSTAMPMLETEEGIWEYIIPLLPKGQYQYKFVIDGRLWKSDPMNYYRVPDGFNGFNSRFFVG